MADDIRITVRYLGGISLYTGGVDEEEFNIKKGSTLEDLVKDVKKKYKHNPDFDSKSYMTLHKDKIYSPKKPGKKKKVKLDDGDEVSFFAVFYGG